MAAPLRGLLSIGVGALWLQHVAEARCASVGVACADFRQCLDLLDLRTAARITEAAKPRLWINNNWMCSATSDVHHLLFLVLMYG